MADARIWAHRRTLIIPFILIAILFAGYSAVWVYGRGVMEDQIDKFIAEEAALGRTITYDSYHVEGYPLSLRAQIDDFTWSSPDFWEWSGERLYIITLPYDPSRLIFAPRGPQQLTYQGKTYDVEADELRVGMEAHKYAVETHHFTVTDGQNSVDIRSLKANWISAEDGSWILGSQTLDLYYRDDEDRLLHFPFLNTAISQSTDVAAPLTLDGIEMSMTNDVINPPTVIKIRGVLGLDELMRPEGKLNFSIRNELALLALAEDFNIGTAKDRDTARTFLGALTANGKTEGTLPVPLILKEGSAYLGPAKVGDVPPIN